MRRTTVAVVLFFSIMSLLLTYPLPLHLSSAVEDRQDALLNVWITAWDGHQLLNDPVHLFDANIFHPYPRTLAYSELLLGNGLLSLPITAASSNPVLGYNVALILSFILSGLGTYLLVAALTRSPAAGIVAGTIFAFCSFRLTNLAQAQLLTTQWLPFAFSALIHLLRRARLQHAVLFALFFSLQALSSFYYGIILALATLGMVLLWLGWRLADRMAGRSGVETDGGTARAPVSSVLGRLVLSACCCALLILPFAVPYFRVQQELGFERTLADSEPFSASLRQYVLVPPRSAIHGLWLPSDDSPRTGGYAVDALFPGLAALILGLCGIVGGRGRARWAFALLLATAWALSLGPRLYVAPGQPSAFDVSLPYAWLYAIVPGFKALRAPVRFDALVALALSVLAGYGMAFVGRMRWQRMLAPRWGLSVGIVAAVLLESWVWPAANTEVVPVAERVPAVARWLADQPPSPILELPMAFTPGGPQLDYQYLSTYHWQPTPDGYSGFIPPKHGQVVYEMDRFPSERSVSLLQALGVRYVVLHSDRVPYQIWGATEGALAEVDALELLEAFGTDRVYGVQPSSFEPSVLKLQPFVPERAAAGAPYTAYIVAVNNGRQSYAVQPTDRIQATVIWESDVGRRVATGSGDIPLVTSPDGGAAVIPVALEAPETQGVYHLTLSEQGGPLGTWDLDGLVVVGDEAETAFPVPAHLGSWTLPSVAQKGCSLEVNLTWKALGKLDAYYSVFVKLLDREGNAVASWDGQPRDGELPTLLWVPGESIGDVVTLEVPVGASPGEYTIVAGMYRAEDLTRCLLLDAEGLPVSSVALGTIQIE